MAFLQLTGGAYQSRTLIAAAQACKNLYLEATPRPQGEPFAATHLCTPGLTLKRTLPQSICRGLYRVFNGDLYGVYGQNLYHIAADATLTDLGALAPPSEPSDAMQRTTPVTMIDNSFVLIVADGSVDGWFVDITQPVAAQTLTKIDRGINTGWLGADYLTYQDTFIVANAPDTNTFYISGSNVTAENFTSAFQVFTATLTEGSGVGYSEGDILTLTGTGGAQITVNTVDSGGALTDYGVTNGGAVISQPANPVAVTGGTGTGATFTLTYNTSTGAFDPLDFGLMTAQANKLVAAVSYHRNLMLIGTTSHEFWLNSGGDGTSQGSFPFAIYPEAFGDWGCVAKYSVTEIMNQAFFLSQDKHGQGMVMRAEGLKAERISTHAIEYAISNYPRIDDCIGMAYQQLGHPFVLFTFPSGGENQRGATWCYDIITNEWHERPYTDSNGLEYRHHANAIQAAYGAVWVGDWRNGNLYQFDLNNYTDNGDPIVRTRSFPHEIDLEANRRIIYQQLIANMQVGAATQEGTSQTVVESGFVAPDGTLLESYSNLNDIGATFTKIGSVELQIDSDAVVASAAGNALYSASGVPSTADYSVQFNVVPTNYGSVAASGSVLYAIGRANASNNGYKAAVASNGSQYSLELIVMGGATHAVALGTLSSGYYQVTLTMQATAISLACMRSADSLWLDQSGNWVGSPVSAVALNDSTYTAAGDVLIGGTWE